MNQNIIEHLELMAQKGIIDKWIASDFTNFNDYLHDIEKRIKDFKRDNARYRQWPGLPRLSI